MIKFGTMRICIVGKKFTYKFPIFIRGIKANRVEYSNYKKNTGIVAYTEKHWWGLKQETLTNLKVYPKEDTSRDEINDEHKFLFPFKVHNRIQIGQDKKGNWKFYDYEDIKFYKRRR